jgi:DNA-binding transcriptional LysR family regulator
MDVQDLYEFVTLAKTLNFSTAASELNMTQSSLSKSIKTIEQELGSVLFDRNTRKVELTSVGRIFYNDITAILTRYEKALEKVHEMSEESYPTIMIGGDLDNRRVADTVDSARRHIKKNRLPIRLEVSNYQLLMSEMGMPRIGENPQDPEEATEGYDAMIIFKNGALASKGLPFVPLYRDPFAVFLVDNGHFDKEQRIDLCELKEHLFIETALYRTYNQRVIEVCESIGFSPELVPCVFEARGDAIAPEDARKVLVLPESAAAHIASTESLP